MKNFNLPTLSLTLEEKKSHARLYGISTIEPPRIGCGLDQMNWQEVVKLLRDIFTYSNVRIVVYTLEENGVHVLSSEGDPDFYAKDEIERYSEEFYLNDKDLERTSLETLNPANRHVVNSFPPFGKKVTIII